MSGKFSVEKENNYNVTVSGIDELESSSSGVQIVDTMNESEAVEDDDDESITPSQLETFVDLMIDQLESMEENFNKCKDHTSLKIILHKMEVQRLTYMINEYIRARLEKIEKDVELLRNEDFEREKTNVPRLLSSAERVFAERYEAMKRHLMETSFLERIPPALQSLPTIGLDMSAERVVIEVNSDKEEQAVIPEMTDMLSERTVDLPSGSIHFIPYPSIADLLEAKKFAYYNALPRTFRFILHKIIFLMQIVISSYCIHANLNLAFTIFT
ncbi:DNA replication complex GINS protein SLD5 [Dirofilaria immitis]|nr:DNA replication complex GINS protein SLD5 [Dirofilaria immitis]